MIFCQSYSLIDSLASPLPAEMAEPAGHGCGPLSVCCKSRRGEPVSEPECLVNRNADCFDAPGWTIFALCPRTMYSGGEGGRERERATVKPGEEDAAALVQEKGRKKKERQILES